MYVKPAVEEEVEEEVVVALALPNARRVSDAIAPPRPDAALIASAASDASPAPPAEPVPASESALAALHLMLDLAINHLPVVDATGLALSRVTALGDQVMSDASGSPIVANRSVAGLVVGIALYDAGADVFWRCLAYLAVFHFVRQQYARGVAVTNLVGNIELVRDQADPATGQAASRVATALVLVDQRLVAQGKAGHPVNLTGKQAILRLVEFDEVVEKHFLEGNGLIIVGANTDICKQAVFLLHFFDRHGPVFVTGNLIAHIEADPGHRRLFFGIHTVFTGSRKQQGNHASFNSNDSPQPQIRLCITNPTLAKCKRH